MLVSSMRRRTRTYDNSLRAEQAETTRRSIIEALVELMAHDRPVSTAAIAAQAGVSEPTVYRHFPNREALMAAMLQHGATNLGGPAFPTSVKELPMHGAAVALYMGRNRNWMLAAMRCSEYDEVRNAGRRKRLAALRRLLEPSVAHLSARDRELAFAAIATTLRRETWEHLVTTHGCSDEDAGRTIAFILDACIEKLANQARERTSAIVDDAVVERARAIDAAGAASVESKRG
jgi:AcrR family transcriptional regulator